MALWWCLGRSCSLLLILLEMRISVALSVSILLWFGSNRIHVSSLLRRIRTLLYDILYVQIPGISKIETIKCLFLQQGRKIHSHWGVYCANYSLKIARVEEGRISYCLFQDRSPRLIFEKAEKPGRCLIETVDCYWRVRLSWDRVNHSVLRCIER
jgi:hypothetical protein